VNPKNTYRRPIPQRAIDPRRCNISCDANALDRDGTTNDQLVGRYSAPSGFLKIIRVSGERHQWQAATKKISLSLPNQSARFFANVRFGSRTGLSEPPRLVR